MHALFRALALSAIVSLTSVAVANAGPQPHMVNASLNFGIVALANGQTLHCRKAGGEQGRWQLFTLNGDGKQVPAAPGSYKQKNGNVIMVGPGGFLDPTSLIKFEPQPEPPGISH
jgi:hypothetical protein